MNAKFRNDVQSATLNRKFVFMFSTYKCTKHTENNLDFSKEIFGWKPSENKGNQKESISVRNVSYSPLTLSKECIYQN